MNNEDVLIPMESGEKELRQAFEEVTKRNVLMCVEHSNATRKLLRELEEANTRTQNTVLTFTNQLDQLRAQIAALLQEKYQGGSS